MGKEMSNTDQSGAGAAAAEGLGPVSKPPFRCEAPELKTILQQIADHVSEADRRHLAALRAMQEQLAELARDTVEARSRLPEAMSPELDRIEDDMAVLAEHMAAAGEAPRDGQGPVAETATDQLPPAGQSDPSRADEPWDRDSAEALTQIYESDVPGMAAYASDQSSGLSDGEGLASTRQPPGAVPEGAHWVEAARERMLLEERCAEIALRVEKALAEIRRECSFVELGNRFERLEQHIASTLAGAVDRAERGTLDRIEAQINELAGRFDAMQAQAARIDRIEANIRTLAERISDERMGELFSKAAAAMPGMPTETVAQLIAERVSAQMPQMDETRAQAHKRLEELHELVSGFLNERREGDAQTATVLDTMQQAMIRLLDRMDAVEEAAPVAPITVRSFQKDAPPTVEPPGQHEQALTPEFGQWGAAQDREVSRAGAGRESRYDPAIFKMYPEPSIGARAGQVDAEAARNRQSAQPQPSDAPPTSWQGDRLGFVPPQQDAQNVVAAARRAMRHAAQSELGEEAMPGSPDRAPPKPPQPVKEGCSDAARSSWFPSRLFIATIAVILAGATFTIATVLRKQMIEESGEHILLLPQGEAVDPPQRGKQDAQRGGHGAESEPTRERQQEPDSGNYRGPELKQRSGEPPPKMHASPEDRMQSREGELGRLQAGFADDAGQAHDGEGLPPGWTAPVLARGSADLPQSVALQETGSIAGAATPSPSQQLQHRSNLEPRSAALIPVRAAAIADPAATDSGTTNAHTLRVLPPIAVGPQSLRVAAANGDPSAEFEVGARLAEGRGVPQDLAQAAAWYQRAAERGFAPAQYRLASLLERGLGVTSDLARARVWYLHAAEQGHAKAMHNAAVLSIGGDGVVPDYATAIIWFTKAAERGLADSQYNLGVLYESGLGVARDPKQAYKWFALAAQAGDEQALRRRDLLRARIAAAELQEADAAIRSWRAESIDPLINEPQAAGTLWQRRGSMGRAG
jgi:localization factor PodJL